MIELNHQSPTAAHWSTQQYESLFPEMSTVGVSPVSPAELDAPLSQRVILVAEDISETLRETAAAGHRIVAFLVARRVDKDWELENIVVAEESQRHGLGSRLLRDLIKHARTRDGNSIFLEVRHSNQSARTFYHKMGFVECGSRKSYYSNPPEDAVLYRLSLSHNETAPEIWH
jgi:[ribosomal protein S18]-alanine N-acetyltransferase